MTALLAAAAVVTALGAHSSASELGELTLEQLTQVTIISASKRPEALFEVPASVFVVTASDIRRAGVRNIPDALRLVPGVEVARDGRDSWSISMRGFNNDLSNKLLVLIDGRTVYSPLYAGVFWDVQNLMIEDIDRIEVIGGPGGTMWGANAVNGVISIITKPATATLDGVAIVSGDDPWVTAVRYGHAIDDTSAVRGYLRYFERPEREHSQGGFRYDHSHADARFTLQGDVYRGSTDVLFPSDFTLGTLPTMLPGAVEVRGHNLLGRGTWELDGGGELRVRAFYDHTHRDIPGTFIEDRDTWDAELQHQLPAARAHQVQWGMGVRYTHDDVENTSIARFDPMSRGSTTLNAFAQDAIALFDGRAHLTLGTKVEHNDYTGLEWQPQVRGTWRFGGDSIAWFAASQAVRIPSRLDTDLRLTAPLALPDGTLLYVQVEGDPDFRAEDVRAYEAGYRFRIGARWSFDAAVYRHVYSGLQVTAAGVPVLVTDGPVPYLLLPASIANGMDGDGVGGTLAANWSPHESWRFQLHYAYLDLNLHDRPGFTTDGPSVAGNSPRHQYGVRAFADLTPSLSLYAGWRRVDDLPSAASPGYDTVDASLLWSPHARVDLSLTATGLGGDHVEFGGYAIEPAIVGEVVWHF